jgi:hypothetical protein
MALNDYETSTERGQPVELFKFVHGDGPNSYYAYTNAEQAIVHDGITYEPLPSEREKIKTKGRGEAQELSIDVPLTAGIAELFRVFPPARVVHIFIRQGHVPNADDPVEFATGENFPVIWVGRVLASSRSGDRATLTCESSAAGMKRVGLRLHYQWPCPLALYSKRCGADKEAAKIATTASTVSANQLTLPVDWNGVWLPAHFLGGLAEWDTEHGREVRTILRVVGSDTLKLNAAATGLSNGDPVDLYLGCPHTLTGCGDLHSNRPNYGGHPFIPLDNPVGKNNHT